MRRLDRVQLLAAAAVACLGVMTLISTSRADFQRQLLWLALGGTAYLLLARLDYRRLRRFGLWPYATCLLALVAVAAAGRAAHGAQRWISLGGLPVQPSELSKVALVIALAGLLGAGPRVGWRQLGLSALLVLPLLGLILVQPDLGTALVLVAIWLGMLFLAGAPRLQLAAVAAAAALVAPLLPRLLHSYQRQRLEAFLDPGRDPLGAGYNLVQARLAVGSGGLFGQGWLHGAQGQLGYVPERTTDFIFAVFAEQFGLAGCMLLLGLFAVLGWRLARAAALAPDRFGFLLACGVLVMLWGEVFQNVGMNLGLTPVAGIPLPLFSYGGSAMLANLGALGIVQSVAWRQQTVAFRDPRPRSDLLLSAARGEPSSPRGPSLRQSRSARRRGVDRQQLTRPG